MNRNIKETKVIYLRLFAVLLLILMGRLTLAAETDENVKDIDKNFRLSKIGDHEVHYHDAIKEPFAVEGFPWRDEKMVFNRLPADFTDKDVNGSALYLSKMTSGGLIRFKTDSAYLSLRAVLKFTIDPNHMPRAASSGFDLYRGVGKNIQYCRSVQPRHDQKDIEVLLVNSRGDTLVDYTLYLPLYGSISSLEIGLAPGAKIETPTQHAIDEPILFYGSSITQGCCASRTGNTYPAMLCRSIDAPMINLGFSGGAMGEIAIAQAIAKLKLSGLVIDYDYNAPTKEELRLTHERFFKAIRKQQPLLPVVILSRANFNGWQDEKDRRDLIRATYSNALNSGDKNIWFIDGELLFDKDNRDACTVDGTHPNDLGFYRMYTNILPVLRRAVEK